MSEAALLSQIQKDLKRSPEQTVIYLEGKSDVDAFFALLGRGTPAGGLEEGFLHEDILVRGLDRAGSRSSAVKARVDLATRSRLSGVFGVVDGDGRNLSDLATAFDAPHLGPLFYWKAYCIENQLVKTGWPAAWGTSPQWEEVFISYGPYVALNRIFNSLDSVLSTFRWARHSKPAFPKPLVTEAEVVAALQSDKKLIDERDLILQFQRELSDFRATVRRNLDEAHALVSGKWLIRHLAPTLIRKDPDRCQYEWIAHAQSVGGLPEVREWWGRVTGSAP